MVHNRLMGLSHPAPDFPIHGLAAAPDGPRWVDGFEGPLGAPADGVWLRHGRTLARDPREPWLRVGTLRGDRFPGPEVAREARTAFTVMFALVDATMPAPTERPDDYKRRVVDHATRHAERHLDWRRVTWTVDGRAVEASVVDWAGAWAGFTCAVPDVDLAVVASGTEPEGLALTRLDDTSDYHFDRTQPLLFPDTVQRAQHAAGAVDTDADDVWWPTHPDHASV